MISGVASLCTSFVAELMYFAQDAGSMQRGLCCVLGQQWDYPGFVATFSERLDGRTRGFS